MTFSLARASLIAEADLVGIAGARAVCDPRGVLYFPELKLLTVSDLHLEKGSSLARRGTLIPPYDTGATLLRLQAVISDYQPSIIISLGDSFHDGGGAKRMHSSFRERLEALMAGR
ncbi:MAG: metallophosphatase, partial [Mesorhizobium sp.]